MFYSSSYNSRFFSNYARTLLSVVFLITLLITLWQITTPQTNQPLYDAPSAHMAGYPSTTTSCNALTANTRYTQASEFARFTHKEHHFNMDCEKLKQHCKGIFATSVGLIFATCLTPHISEAIALWVMLPSGIAYCILELYLIFRP